MTSNKVFQIALLFSALAHGVLFFQSGNLHFLVSTKKENKVEISYIKNEPLPRERQKNILHRREPLAKFPAKITLQDNKRIPSVEKEQPFRRKSGEAIAEANLPKPVFTKPDIISVKKKITLPPVDMDKIDNPSYVSYYQIVREKIKRAAYQYYGRSETGEVYLTFVISMAGMLKEARLIEEKSAQNSYLREVAMRSIREASPFPDFPKELDYPQLSFNVIISFEVE